MNILKSYFYFSPQCLLQPSYTIFLKGAVPKGNATTEGIKSLGLKKGEVVFKCPKCISIKPDRAHHCR